MMKATIVRNVRIGGQLFDLTVQQETGTFGEVVPAGQAIPSGSADERILDAAGLLYLPALHDMHIHLDKHFLGEPWRPLQPFVTLPGQLAFEKQQLAALPTTVAERARRLIGLLLSHGTTKIRTHIDVDPVIGSSHIEQIAQIQDEFRDVMEIEIVAFPQQGLLRSSSIAVMKEAMRAGAAYVGGVDPAGLDRQVDRSLEAMFELSAEFNAGVDLHLHDPSHLGLYTISRFADLTVAAGQSGRTAVSHAYCLGQVPEADSRALAQQLKSADVAIITSVPIDRPMPRVDQLLAEGVRVYAGSDNILDAWSPFGNGDLLARGSRLAEKFGWIIDGDLLQMYPLITGGGLVPAKGERADFMLVSAQNPQHALAAVPRREAVFSKGRLIGGQWFEGSGIGSAKPEITAETV
ncbi:cytosine/adenosine deaminase-related metal-dependent hydrolase [Paenibacillus phyllosphaerae]|uniref:Cytosine/adenosine deaminase-related metal-dependent hydrolase n=1 Tax=Paenibacillus phyllosphaerae TaxID=274593 RepID=A0A7W5B3L6_9BACL|nr:amidohydrolase family protein [Paenibacillus phyllosphaerae]MBB3113808.1 cytosine/adenosine deaminase-related metal-dependent hydrolase [Paenibacillus phyllosphaerae]